MNRPGPDALRDFFRSDVFNANDAPDFEKAIAAFYRRFDPEFDAWRYNEIGIRVNRIVREPYIIEEQNAQDAGVRQVNTRENITTIYFCFIQKPEMELSFILWGDIEEKPFFSYSKDELIDFFKFRFRRFSEFLIR
ncbi:hypothetical protein [Dyadobacter sp. LHD-138]|uniref:hypothetical protein n=1 Tax=Dyadobacter sp. LHD-138 TaxID=3071413 RepID=UPI0027DF3AC7|nr:hypothetical protein [Dyadobacter sp. LHD-138]MDQ6481597.1 hypothetical protein [Dyadobacter sp. LHD-138]